MNKSRVLIFSLRGLHGLFAGYFIICIIYLYYAALFASFDTLLIVAVISLAIEGFAVYVLNKGDCPLTHIQQKINDPKPFFELFFPPSLAKRAIPIFAKFALVGMLLLVLRILTS